jgi:hypothetical protein
MQLCFDLIRRDGQAAALHVAEQREQKHEQEYPPTNAHGADANARQPRARTDSDD